MTKVFVDAREVKEGRFIDARFNLKDKEWGQLEYTKDHIQGALHWDLERDLSDLSKSDGRHPLPSKEQLLHLFEQSGLQQDDTIYIYDQGAAPFASRAWWMLKYASFPNVYIVNGGYDALKQAGFPVTNEVPEFTSSTITVHWNDSIYASREDVRNIIDKKVNVTILDARAAERYRGDNEPIDRIAGHIPTAKNFDWEQLIEGTSLRPNEQLEQKVSKDEDIVVYCGSGVTAATLYSLLEEAGYEKLRLYVGSFSDWIAHYDVETGENL